MNPARQPVAALAAGVVLAEGQMFRDNGELYIVTIAEVERHEGRGLNPNRLRLRIEAASLGAADPLDGMSEEFRHLYFNDPVLHNMVKAGMTLEQIVIAFCRVRISETSAHLSQQLAEILVGKILTPPPSDG